VTRFRSLTRAVVLATALAVPALAEDAPRFAIPIDCRVGTACFVQNYVDHDPGPGAADFACGSLTYDGHDGSDFRLTDLVAMAQGVAVLAAADGVVLRTRDGMADISVAETGPEAVAGREAGNGVVIDHGGGWETQYGHMRQGSVAVEPGQAIAAGEPIGLVGLSGLTEFPHVEFLVRHDGQPIDPFTGQPPGSDCGTTGAGLWNAEAAAMLAYRAGGLLSAGFATEEPDPGTAREGAYGAEHVARDAPALVFWVDVFGTRDGDRESIRLVGPNGTVLVEQDTIHDRDRAQWFRFAGKRAPEGGWPAGTYVGTYRLVRDAGGVALTVAEVERAIVVP
jgi:hypothetical protein